MRSFNLQLVGKFICKEKNTLLMIHQGWVMEIQKQRGKDGGKWGLLSVY